ncbi:MAG: hypothetical protein IT381_29105 [Deltaproteobacteria bacterium]|nr:hypothetical protein [Deltaproteobacteria bacterium]
MKKKSEVKLELEAVKASSKKLSHVLSQDVAQLTPEERQRLAGVRWGFERHAPLVASLAKERGMEVEGRSIPEMFDDLEMTETLHLVRGELAVTLARVEDTILKRRAQAYRTFLTYYRLLNAMAEDVVSVATQIEPVNDFFAPGPQPKKTAIANSDKEGDAPAKTNVSTTDTPKPPAVSEKVPA